MAVESKIRELLKGAPEMVTEEVNELDESAARPADKSQGDSTPPTQGSSEANPEQEKLESDDALSATAGKSSTAKAKKDGSKSAKSSVSGDQTSPKQGSSETASTEGQVNKPGSKADVKAEDTEIDDEVLDEEITDEEVEAQVELDEDSDEEVEEVLEEDTLFQDDVSNLFADEEHLSEEFKVKAAGLFEAVVTARVTSEMEDIKTELAEEAALAQETFMEDMVQKIDGYLNYVAENWMKENELAIERGLRNEITESFVGSLKEVFAEHYIEVPQEKYDVLGEMQGEIESLKAKLNESTEEKVALSAANVELSKDAAIKEATADLTVTEAEKFAKLVEDVEFDSDYSDKLGVIKENYFPTQKADLAEDKLVDDDSIVVSDVSSPISIYAQAISKSVK